MVRTGVIGYGYWGPNLVRNYMENDSTELTYVCDLNPALLETVKKRYPSVKVTTNPDEVFNAEDVDAVSIATPVYTHFDLAMKALQAGKHVLVEKPMSDSSEHCEQMLEEADKRGLALMVDHTFPYTGAVKKIQELVKTGDLGDVQYFDSSRINLGLFQTDVNVLWDLAVHDLSIMEAVFDYHPISVSATGIAHVEGSPVNTAFMTLFFKESFIAHINVSWLAPVKVRQTLIGGTEKMVVYNDMEPEEKVRVYDKGITVNPSPENVYKMRVGYRAGDIWVPKLERKEALRELVAHFTDVIENGAEPLTSGISGARIVRMLEAATQSLEKQGECVSL